MLHDPMLCPDPQCIQYSHPQPGLVCAGCGGVMVEAKYDPEIEGWIVYAEDGKRYGATLAEAATLGTDNPTLRLGRMVELLGTIGMLDRVTHEAVEIDGEHVERWRIRSVVADPSTAKYLIIQAQRIEWSGYVLPDRDGLTVLEVVSRRSPEVV